jgi:hypothetical protein
MECKKQKQKNHNYKSKIYKHKYDNVVLEYIIGNFLEQAYM